MLESSLFEVKDHRRKQGMRYQQGHILLFRACFKSYVKKELDPHSGSIG